MLVLNENSKTPLYVQLYQQIKADILSGNMRAGTKLKSSRAVSMELHISRNTVKLAYDQLYAEGFITSRLREGYYVEALIDNFQECESAGYEEDAKTSDENIAYDFRCGRLLPFELPCSQWQRLLRIEWTLCELLMLQIYIKGLVVMRLSMAPIGEVNQVKAI